MKFKLHLSPHCLQGHSSGGCAGGYRVVLIGQIVVFHFSGTRISCLVPVFQRDFSESVSEELHRGTERINATGIGFLVAGKEVLKVLENY